MGSTSPRATCGTASNSELLGNVSLRVEDTDSPEQLKVIGRGELQLSILIEMMRREGFELQVSRPEIVTREIDGVRSEPVEEFVIDIPDEFQGVVIAQVGHPARHHDQDGEPRQRAHPDGVPYPGARPDRVPVAVPDGYARDRHPEPPVRWLGALARAHPVAHDRGARRRPRRHGHGLRDANLQERGEIFIEPQTEVYEGMIIGENSRTNDMDVNVTKEKKQTNMRASTADEAIRLIPPRRLGLEQASAFINDDELVEVTPKSIRLRKRILAANMRPRKDNT